MNTHWRSRDAYKAAFMNIFALTDLQRAIAEEVSIKISKTVKVGRYVDMADSYHIYGSYFDQFKGFLETLEKKTFEERTFLSSFAESFFKEAKFKIQSEKK
jgi:thymidylate synthase